MCLKPQISALLTETVVFGSADESCCVVLCVRKPFSLWPPGGSVDQQSSALKSWTVPPPLPFLPFYGITTANHPLPSLPVLFIFLSHNSLCVLFYRLCKSPLWIWLGRKKAHESMVQRRTADLTISCHDFLYIYMYKTKLFLIVGFVDRKLWP